MMPTYPACQVGKRLSRDVLYAARQDAAVDRSDSGQRTSSGRCPIQDRVYGTAIRNRTGRGPPLREAY